MSNNALYMIVTVIFMVGLAVIGILISRGWLVPTLQQLFLQRQL